VGWDARVWDVLSTGKESGDLGGKPNTLLVGVP